MFIMKDSCWNKYVHVINLIKSNNDNHDEIIAYITKHQKCEVFKNYLNKFDQGQSGNNNEIE